MFDPYGRLIGLNVETFDSAHRLTGWEGPNPKTARDQQPGGFMANEKNVNSNEVARFLLGLGIGLVVGMLFKPQAGDYRGGSFHKNAKAGTSVSAGLPSSNRR